MADERFELEDGELEVAAAAMNGPSSSSAAADVQLRAQLHEAATVLRHRGQADLARLALGLVDAHLRDAMWVLSDDVRGGGGGGGDGDEFEHALFDWFRLTTRMHLLTLQETGYDEDEIHEAFPAMVLQTAQHVARLAQVYYDINETTSQQPYRDGAGFGAVPSSAAAVRTLEKQTFFPAAAGGSGSVPEGGRGGVTDTECSICFEEFVDGGQVSVMPCPSHRHRFHPDCINKWLGISNMCPLCRHVLPVYEQ